MMTEQISENSTASALPIRRTKGLGSGLGRFLSRQLPRLFASLMSTWLVEGPSSTLNAATAAWTEADAVQGVARVLEERYADEAVGKRYASTLQQHLQAGRYAGLTNGTRLAGRLTQDLQAVHPDRHLRVEFSADVLPVDGPTWTPSAEELAAMRRHERRVNSGFEKVEVFRGNIGYLSFRYFGDPEAGAPKVHAAMQYLADTEALIIDLRENGGAHHPGLMDMMTRYLVRDEDIVEASVEWRGPRPPFLDEKRAYLPVGPRYLDKPVFILTSPGTFSGAEAFAYNLQAMKRATLVGERSGGGANPGGTVRAGDHFAVWVPMGVVTHPITKTNWEGVGVTPDIEVKVSRALDRAKLAALDALLQKAESDPGWREGWRRDRDGLARELSRPEPVVSTAFQLAGFPTAAEVCVVGAFNGWAPRRSPMVREANVWKATLDVPPGRQLYKLWVDGEWLLDPANPEFEIDSSGHTNSVRVVTQR